MRFFTDGKAHAGLLYEVLPSAHIGQVVSCVLRSSSICIPNLNPQFVSPICILNSKEVLS